MQRARVIVTVCVLFCQIVLGCNQWGVPNEVKNIKLQAVPSTSSIKVAWDPPDNDACVDNYLVVARPSHPVWNEPREPTTYQVLTVYQPFAKFFNLKGGTGYYIDVVPVSKDKGQGPFTTKSIKTGNRPYCDSTEPPGPPQNVKAQLPWGQTDKVQLTWSPPESPGDGCVTAYKVEGSEDKTGQVVYRATVTSDLMDVTAYNLKNNTQYKFWVQPQSAAGDGKFATLWIKTVPSATAMFLSVPDSPPEAPAPAPAPESAPAPQPAPTPAPTVPNPPGCSMVKPATPLYFTATAEGRDKITLSWQNGDASACIDSYKIDGYELKTGDRMIDATTTYTVYTATQLQPNVEYAFTLSAVNQVATSTPATAMVNTWP